MAKVLKRDIYLQHRAAALQQELNILENNINEIETEITEIKRNKSAEKWKLIRRHRVLPFFSPCLYLWGNLWRQHPRPAYFFIGLFVLKV